MKSYILKDGTQIEAIPVGKAKIKIGDISPDGMLTICDRAPNKPGSRRAMVICLCHCGNYTVLNAQYFYNGHTKSCGCYNKEYHKETCKTLGKKSPKPKDYTKIDNPYYTFIKRLEKKDKNNSFIWEIQCKNCGKKYEAVPAQLISDSRRKGINPCNCQHSISKGVLKIMRLLKEANIPFIQEYSFNDCLSPKGNKLKFDFYLPENNCLIEYDGEQHVIPTSFGDKKISGEEKMKLCQEYDNIKNEYCKTNNIALIRISYTQYNNITINDLIPNKEGNNG